MHPRPFAPLERRLDLALRYAAVPLGLLVALAGCGDALPADDPVSPDDVAQAPRTHSVQAVATTAPSATPSATPALTAYPGPTSAATSSPTPTATGLPDARGFLPPPASARVATSTLEDSPFRPMLEELQQALDSRDPGRVAAVLDPSSISKVGPVDQLFGGSHVSGLVLAEPYTDTLQLLEGLFAAGSEPQVQGYLLEYSWDDYACGQIVIHGFRGEVPLPPGKGGSTELARYPPEDAAAWDVCISPNTQRWWGNWFYMEYYPGVEYMLLAQNHFEAPYVALVAEPGPVSR